MNFNYNVVLFRGGSPDKANLDLKSGSYLRLNNKNLVDLSETDINNYINQGYYLLPSDEGDILAANKFMTVDQTKILLPRSHNKIIDYNLIYKDSDIYKYISENTDFVYCKYQIIEETDLIKNYSNLSDCAIKTTSGSGSRGVIVCNKHACELGLSGYKSKILSSDLHQFLKFYNKEISEGRKCKIMIQDLIPIDAYKVNVDFVIKNGELLTYKWDLPEIGSNFTNWNWLRVIKNDYTDSIMKSLTSYLVDYCRVTDAIMNFEAYQYGIDKIDKIWLVEFNWRYSNSMFEAAAFDDDLVYDYLSGHKFSYPLGSTEVIRSWKAICKNSLTNFK